MSEAQAALTIDGQVDRPVRLTAAELAALDSSGQVDVSQLSAKRRGEAVRLETLLDHVGAQASGTYLTLHATADDFHASVPLDAVRESGVVIYRQDGQPLTADAGGPFRFFVADHAACQTAEVDECANVKFVDWIEVTAGRGKDTRPTDEATHEALHREEKDRGK